MSSTSNKRVAFAFLGSLFVASAVLAQAVGGPVANWTVPPYRASSASGGISTMADISDGSVFIAVTPCRVVDTRGTPGAFGGPALAAGATRAFDIDSGPCTGIPAGSAAYSLSIGAILPPGDGFLTAWPTGSSEPVVSQLNYLGGEVVANAAIVPGGTNGQINVKVNVGPTNVYIDINGYFMDYGGILNPGVALWWAGTNGSQVLFVHNLHNTTSSFYTTAIRGYMQTNEHGPSAVMGHMASTSGFNFGVLGVTESAGVDSAGVKGVSGRGDPFGLADDCGPCQTAGVRGVSGTGSGYGVLGLSRDLAGVAGVILDDTGTGNSMAGYLGADFGFDEGSNVGPDWGVFAEGDIGATGVKYFVDPHPTDASKIIRYAVLEGPEAGTYFRGRGKFQNGFATIAVPEDFRLVTDAEGLGIQVTPIGEMATVAVAHIGLDRIVVRGSRNVEFFFTVNGVRSTFKNLSPIVDGSEFMPNKQDAKLPSHLSEAQKQRLISNGTYRPDGTVNMETARRLGWDRVWEARRRPQPQTETPSPNP